MFEVVIIVQYHISEIHRSLLGMYKMVYSGPKKKKRMMGEKGNRLPS